MFLAVNLQDTGVLNMFLYCSSLGLYTVQVSDSYGLLLFIASKLCV